MTWNEGAWTTAALKKVGHDPLGALVAEVMTAAVDGQLVRSQLNDYLRQLAVVGADEAALRRIDAMAIHLVRLHAARIGGGLRDRQQLFTLRQLPARIAYSEMLMRDAREDLAGRITAEPMEPDDVDALLASVEGTVSVSTLDDPAAIAEGISRSLFGVTDQAPLR